MKQTKLLILSDLHLERRNDSKKDFLLNIINERVYATKESGYEPIVVFAGDVDNCTKGHDWLAKINAKVLYVAGNHEFWEGDYYEVLEDLKKNSPSNVYFLNNDVAVCGQYLVLGTTLWTDVGRGLNPDIFTHAASRMNDMSYIQAKKWYDNPENIEAFKRCYKGYDVEQTIKNKTWNALIEVEENKKAWDFLNYCNDVLSILHRAQDITENAHKDIQSKYKWRNISQEDYMDICEKLEYRHQELNWSDFVETLFSLNPNYKISQEEKEIYLKGNLEQKNVLFQQLRKVENIHDKEIVVLSHHLPFYEEILVGTMMYESERHLPRLHNPINEKLFLVREGQNYPGYNYLFRAAKGELERSQDITHIVNYYNDGASKLGGFLANKTKIWIHGHEHHFNHCDFVKNIQIVTNPLGMGMNVFEFDEQGKAQINQHYLKYHQVKPENYEKEIEKLKNSFIRSPNDTMSDNLLKDATQLWTLKHYDWDGHVQVLNKINTSAKDILMLSLQYIQLEESEDEDENSVTPELNLAGLEEKISLACDAYNYNCDKLFKMQESLQLAFLVRTNKEFNIKDWATGSQQGYEDINSWTFGNANLPEKIHEGFVGRFSAQKAFEAQENIKLAHKYCQRVQQFVSSCDFQHIYQVQEQDIIQFNKKASTSIDRYRMSQKIGEKWDTFYKRVIEPTELKTKKSLDF